MKDDRSAALRFALVASSVLLAGLAQFFISDGDLQWAVTPLVVAVGCLALAAGKSRPQASSPTNVAPDVQPPLPIAVDDGTGWKSLLRIDESMLGALAFAFAAILMSVSLLDFDKSEGENLTLAWWSFGLAVTLLLAAIPAIDGRWTALADRLKRSGGVHVSLRDIAVWLTVAAILAVSAVLRLYNLDDIPAGLWFDEADNLVQARHYALDPGLTPAYAPSTNLPTLFLLPIAALVKLTGIAVTTPRLVAAAFGVAGVAVTFLFVRQIMGTRCGLIAAFLVGMMRWDIVWSRIGMHGDNRSPVRGSDRMADAARRPKRASVRLRPGGSVARTWDVVLHIVPHVSDHSRLHPSASPGGHPAGYPRLRSEGRVYGPRVGVRRRPGYPARHERPGRVLRPHQRLRRSSPSLPGSNGSTISRATWSSTA